MTTEEIGFAIKERRKRLGLTQRRLAQIAQCSTPSVVAAEAGKATLRLSVLMALIDVLGLDLKVVDRRTGL